MCGIVGVICRVPQRPVDAELLGRMTRLIAHRGPDGEAVWTTPGAGLGHTRLAIIDLPGGAQPLFSDDRSVAVVYNGEIYNFRTLREELEQAGHRFRTRCDTEVLLHGYREWGSALPERLRGMFAFCVLETATGRAFFARDRFGKKPLYYTVAGRGTPEEALVFASEIAPLLAWPGVSRELDPEGLVQYFAYQYVPEPRLIFRHIRKLPAASAMTWERGTQREWQYWKPVYEPKFVRSEADLAEEGLARLREAVHLRLQSDVPVGCFLSAGMDSSSVAALAAEAMPGLATFSAKAPGEAENELPDARRTAAFLGTNHHELNIEGTAAEASSLLAWRLGEPVAKLSAIAFLFLHRWTSQFVRVVLSGDGGDEVFAGYPEYVAYEVLAKHRDRYPEAVRRFAGAVYDRTGWQLSRFRRVSDFLRRSRKSVLTRERLFIYNRALFGARDIARVLAPEHRAAATEETVVAPFMATLGAAEPEDAIDRLMLTDLRTHMVSETHLITDRLSMAHGLETRLPMFDHEFAGFMARIPAEMKLAGGQVKAFQKRLMGPVLPEWVLSKRKIGFGRPDHDWFFRDAIPLARRVLLAPETARRGIYDMGQIRQWLDAWGRSRMPVRSRLWGLLQFEVWARTYLDPVQPSGPIDLTAA